ncbi:MAG: glycosyltransferase family 4 protein [Gemmatimonadaceae bacterium]
MTAKDATPHSTATRPRVLFVNTRSALGADVAVHLSLIQNLNPDSVDVYVATNQHSVDIDATVRMIRMAPRVRLVVCDLGHEVQGDSRIGRAVSALRNVPALFTLLRLFFLIRRERISVLHTTDRPRDAAFTTLLGKLTGAAVVLHVHLKWTPHIGRAAHWAAHHARAVVSISRFTSNSLIEGGIEPERIFMAYNATDAERFNPAVVPRGALRSKLGIDASIPLIGIVGRFMIWKGHLDLVTAFAQVRAKIHNARLVLVGRATSEDASGPDSYLGLVKRRIHELNLADSVDWAEWTDDVPAVMTDFDVMAMPSFEEPFGLVVTECMSMERPVVAYASGALPEIIADGVEGLLVPPRDTDALARALIMLLEDPALRLAMGTRGRQRVISDFSPLGQATVFTELYRALALGEPVPRT